MNTFTTKCVRRVMRAVLFAGLAAAFGLPAHAYTVTVRDTAGLRAALYDLSIAPDAAHNGDVDNTIIFGNSITLSSELWAINLPGNHNLTIDGAGFALDGANQHRGFFVNRGRVTISRLTIRNAVARGGTGYKGGGGGAGLGGGLFVRAAAAAILDRVDFVGNDAIGGNSVGGVFLGGGGGLGGDGGDTASRSCGGGGGIGRGATGGGSAAPRGAGIIPGDSTAGNTQGGGGAGTGPSCGSGGTRGGTQLFGGGGGGEAGVPGGDGGFGGGAGGGQGICCRTAGFGGGGATYGAGDGATGGGGLGAGGAIFVQRGGELIFRSGSVDGGTAVGGVPPGPTGASNSGRGYGSGLFLEGAGSAVFEPAAGERITLSDTLADMRGSEPTRLEAALILKRGAGTLRFGDRNLIGGRLLIEGGVLEVSADDQLGTLSAPIEIRNGAALRITGTTMGSSTRSFALLDGGGAFDIATAGRTFTLANALGGSATLTKRGPGTLAIGAGNTFTGDTVVETGALTVTGELSPGGSVTVRAGASLGGTGRVGEARIEAGGVLRANVATSALRAAALVVEPDGVLLAQLGAAAAGRIEVADTVRLDGGLLEVVVTPGSGPLRTFTLVDHRGGGPVVGTFAGLAEGAEIAGGGGVFRISYVGGDGNDVVLTELDIRFRNGFEAAP